MSRPWPGARTSASILLLLGLLLGQVACDGASHDDSTSPEPSQVGIPEGASLRDMLEADRDPLERVERVARHLQRLGPDDLDATRKAFDEAVLDRGDIEYSLFAEWWARFDPIGAMNWADSNMKGNHPRVVAAVVRRWATDDPQGAATSGRFYKIQTGAPVYRADLLDALVVGWFDSGKPGLELFIQELGPTDKPRGLQTLARRRMLRDGFRETLDWTREAPGFEEDSHRLLTASALTVAAMQDPLLAVEYLKIAEEDGIDTRTFVPRIAASFGDLDHQAALEWLETVEPGADRNNGISRVTGIWVRKDPDSLQKWVAERDGEAWLDMVRVILIRREINLSRYEVDWEEMIARTEKIVDREQALVNVAWIVQRWSVIDEPAAFAWIDAQPGLPQETRDSAKQISPAIRVMVEKTLERGR